MHSIQVMAKVIARETGADPTATETRAVAFAHRLTRNPSLTAASKVDAQAAFRLMVGLTAELAMA